MEYKVCTSELKQSDDTNFILDHFISTETQDDGGDVLLADGMETRGKVVVLFQHGYDMLKGHEPIAKPLSITIGINAAGAKGIIARTQFFPDEQGKRLYQKSKEGYSPNWSVGWNPLQVEPIVGGGRRVTKWQLMEYSLVAVGMNPEAVTEATKALEGIGLQFKEAPPVPEPAVEDKGCGGGSARERLRAHKALAHLHGLMVSDLKEAASAENFVDEGAKAAATSVIEDFGDNVPPHVMKYIKAVSDMDGNEEFDSKNEPDLEAKGYQAHHNSLNKVFGEMVESIRSFKCKKETNAEKESGKIIKAHGEAALPHAVEFVKAYAQKLSEDKKAMQHKEPDPAAPEPVATLELKQPDVVLTVENPPPPEESMVSLPCSAEELKQMMTETFTRVAEDAGQKAIRKLQGKLD
jgi:hypothetical protein